MTIRLEALSATDGTGIFRKEGTIRLLRPPYRLQDSPVLPEESLHNAIARFGFSPSTQEFSSWPQAIEYLNRKTVESRQAIAKELPDAIRGADIIEDAPEEVLRDFLERVDKELIPQRLFDEAENFLLVFLGSSAMTSHPDLAKRAADLFQLTMSKRRQTEVLMSELVGHDLRFPNLSKHGRLEESDRVAEQIKNRHCVFA